MNVIYFRFVFVIAALGIFGHVVNPGCLSFYTLDGRTFAVSQGRWWVMDGIYIFRRWSDANKKILLTRNIRILLSPKAFWIAKNVSIDQEMVRTLSDQPTYSSSTADSLVSTLLTDFTEKDKSTYNSGPTWLRWHDLRPWLWGATGRWHSCLQLGDCDIQR